MTFWHQVSAPLALPAFAEGAFDLAVVGAGFTGLSTALHAAQAGLRVVVLEAQEVAFGASGANAGFVVPNFAKVAPDAVRAKYGPRLVAMAAGSADLVFGLIAQHGIDCQAGQGGWLQPSHSQAALARAEAQVRLWQAEGRPVEMLSAAQVAEMTRVQGWRGGWIDRSAGTLNPVAYARGLARAALAAGALVHDQTPVTALTPEGPRWRLSTARGFVTASRVVLATNAHAGALVPGLAQSFFPLRVFQIATEPLTETQRQGLLPNGMALSDSRRNLFTYRQAGDRLITGGMHIISPGAETRVPARILARLSRALGLPLRLAEAWSGMAAVTPDFLPRVIEPLPGVLAGFACNGRGIAMTTALGRELADWAQGRPSEDLAVPKVALSPLPFHALARLAPNALLPWSMLKDRLESAPGLPV